jgi:hypothetical protein
MLLALAISFNVFGTAISLQDKYREAARIESIVLPLIIPLFSAFLYIYAIYSITMSERPSLLLSLSSSANARRRFRSL